MEYCLDADEVNLEDEFHLKIIFMLPYIFSMIKEFEKSMVIN